MKSLDDAINYNVGVFVGHFINAPVWSSIRSSFCEPLRTSIWNSVYAPVRVSSHHDPVWDSVVNSIDEFIYEKFI